MSCDTPVTFYDFLAITEIEPSDQIWNVRSADTVAADKRITLADFFAAVSTSYTLLSGGVVSEQSTPDMTVAISAGSARVNGAYCKWAAQSSGTITAPITNPRYDVVVVNSDNTISIVTGTESATPLYPSISASQKVVAVIYLESTTTSITTSDITDARSQGCYFISGGVFKYSFSINDAISDLITNNNGYGSIIVRSGSYQESITYTSVNEINIYFENNSSISTTGYDGEYLITSSGIENISKTFDSLSATTLTATNITSEQMLNNKHKNNDSLIRIKKVGENTTFTGLGGSRVLDITALSFTSVAIIQVNELRLGTYSVNAGLTTTTSASESSTLLSASTANIGKVCALSPTSVATYDDITDEIRKYSFSGGAWSLVGNGFSFVGMITSLCALTSSRIVATDFSGDLRCYDFDGTDWSQTGNTLSTGFATKSCTLSASSICSFGNFELRKYNFDGTDFVAVGNAYSSFTGDSPQAIVAIEEDIVCAKETFGYFLKFDGTDWSQVSKRFYVTGGVVTSSAALSRDSIVFCVDESGVSTSAFFAEYQLTYENNYVTTPPFN